MRWILVALLAGELALPATSQVLVGSTRLELFDDPDAPIAFAAYGDVDGDGDEDLVAVSDASGGAGYKVFLGDGMGGLVAQSLVPAPASWRPLLDDSTSGKPISGPLVDVTGDGIVDFVSLWFTHPFNWTEQFVAVFPGDGAGGFSAPVATSLLDRVLGWTFADVSGGPGQEIGTLRTDPDNDRYVVRWWSWNAGTLVPSSAVYVPDSNTGLWKESLTALDYDGDGVEDLVATAEEDHLLYVFPTVAGQPTDTLAPIAAPFTQTIHNQNFTVDGVDADGDGDEDLLVTAHDTNQDVVRAAVLHLEAGVVTTGPEQLLPVVWTRTDFYFADWDGDGDLDLLRESGAAELYVYANDGTGDFSWEAAYALASSAGPRAGALDLNEDGHVDYVGARGVTFGDGSMRTEPQSLDVSGRHAHVDLDGDGDVDLVGEDDQRVLNDGAGNFGTIEPVWPAPVGGDPAIEATVSAGDFDGDGRIDLLVRTDPFPSGATVGLLRADVAGGYVLEGPAAPADVDLSPDGNTNLPDMFPAVDIDGDGDVDVLVKDGYLANDGTGSFTFASEYAGEPFAVGDFEPDGDIDVLVLRPNGNVVLRRNTGAGSFQLSVLASQPDADGVGFVDLDGDGDLDIVVGGVNAPAADTRLFENDGGAWVETTQLPEHSQRFAVEDVDDDGIPDLLLGQGSLVVLYRGTDAAALTYERVGSFLHGAFSAFVDIDQDGDLDTLGWRAAKSRHFHGPGAGQIQQYGTGVPGTGGAVPLLGGTGPFRPGSTTATLRLRDAVGGTTSALLIGLDRTAVPGLFLGGTLYVDPVLLVLIAPLPGTPGAAGEGGYDLPLDGLLDVAAGFPLTFQVVVLDGGALVNKSSTGGVEILFGL